jgi:hypothetical protein
LISGDSQEAITPYLAAANALEKGINIEAFKISA